jgi:ABC-type transporter Mla MlaB component
MPMKNLGNEISLIGNLNEQFDMNEVAHHIAGNPSVFSKCVKLNFKDVPRANSCGIATLLKLLSSLECSVDFVHCPTWLVDQLNQIDEFFQINLNIVSIYAPYMDASSHDYTLRLIELKEGFFSSDEYENIEVYTNSTGQTLSADFDKDDYFSFSKSLKARGNSL